MNNIIERKLCKTKEEFKYTLKKRKSLYEIKSIASNELSEYTSKGWELQKEYRSKVDIRKQKSYDHVFEDEVWLMFYNLGFNYMNADRKLKINFKVYSKQVDILAVDDNNIFVVECKSSQSEDPLNAKQALEELLGKKDDINKVLKKIWPQRRINLVVVISSSEKRKKDIEYVEENKKYNIFLWSKKEINYITKLTAQVGPAAKYQLYSVIFAGKKQKSLQKEYLAIKSKIGGYPCYSFIISAKDLLKYTYIHHRELHGIIEASQAYQRMLNKTKINEIADFIDKEDGFFPNSIIINFTKKLEWKQKEKINNISTGTIILPPYYGSAWIIDGQHRIYGAASANRNIVFPILAFENITQRDQANMFVEINKKQKKVPADLLWDLYSDLYRDSEDSKQKFLFQIAEIAKKLEKSSPLKNMIDIPSIPKRRSTKLSLTTICSTLEKFLPWTHIKHPTDEEKTPEYVSNIITCYYEVLKELWPEDWNKGNNGVLLTNNGFGVFIMIFHDIINHLAYKEKTNLFSPNKKLELKNTLKKYLEPLIENLKKDENIQDAIRSQTGRGPQSDNAAYLELFIQEKIKDFSPPRIESIPKMPAKKPELSQVKNLVTKAEFYLRSYILDKIKRYYNDDLWWKQGIPGHIKKEGNKKWEEEIKRKPYLKDEPNQLEKKFQFFGLGELKDIVFYGQNWQQIFYNDLGDRQNFERRIKDIMVLRNPISHGRELSELDIYDGATGLYWLSNTLGIPELNPYREQKNENPLS